jgi:DNA-binding transcriptional LysR family regulator
MRNNDAMQDLSDIRIFLEVARQRSFVAAARQLSLTPPTVTRAVGSLEESLGVQLLLRTTRQVTLTTAGAVYAARIGPLLRDFETAADELREQHGDTVGLIRVNAPLSLGQQILPDMIAGFRVEHPGTSVSLSLTDQFIDIVAGSFDLAIRISEPPRDKSTIWRKICPVRRLLVASPGYLGAYGEPQSPDDLDPARCLGFDAEALGETWELSSSGKIRRLRAGTNLVGNNGELISRLAENGQGVALLPLFIVEDALKEGRLKQILADWEPPQLWLTLYYPPYDRLPARVAKFSDFFEDYVTRVRPV